MGSGSLSINKADSTQSLPWAGCHRSCLWGLFPHPHMPLPCSTERDSLGVKQGAPAGVGGKEVNAPIVPAPPPLHFPCLVVSPVIIRKPEGFCIFTPPAAPFQLNSWRMLVTCITFTIQKVMLLTNLHTAVSNIACRLFWPLFPHLQNEAGKIDLPLIS